MNNNVLIGAAALLIGGAGGFIIGQGGTEEPTAEADLEPGSSKLFRAGSNSSSGATSAAARPGARMTFREIMNEPGQTRRMEALMDYYANLTADQFAAEVEKLDDLPFGDRILAGTLLFSRWAELDPEGAYAAAESMGRDGFFARPSVIRSWASSNPVAASQFFEENADDMGGRRGPGGPAGQIAREWAKQDPVAALDWAQGLEGDAGRQAVGDIFSQLTIDDPARATELAAGLSGEQQSEAYGSIARAWSREDFDAAEQWINSLPADQRDPAMVQAINSLSDDDPALAALKVAGLTDQGAIEDAVRSVARDWSQEDPASTAEWLVQQDVEELGWPMEETMRNWTNQDPQAALEFVNAQPEGELRDTAASRYINAYRDGDVQESLALATTINDDRERGRSIGTTVARWAREDEAAAMEYLETSSDITDEQRGRITRIVQEGGDDRQWRWGRRR